MCFLLSNAVYAQNIRGTVTDTLGNAIPFAGLALKNTTNMVISYTLCKEDGTYTLSFSPTMGETLRLEAAILGYKKQNIAINQSINVYNFSLSTDNIELKTVIVKDTRPRLRIKGDTINYKAADFSSQNDRVVGDVLKKIPGVEVDDNGTISYNGKPISNFYIGGDNLLNGRYNIATDAIPNAIIENIQIIENDQPIKILRGKTISDKVAVNITFKKDAKLKLIGKAMLGAGIPSKYNADIYAMSFKDRYKGINTFKANNTGVDVAYDIVSHNTADYAQRTESSNPPAMLSLGTAGSPDLPINRYLFNQAALLNINNLINLGNDVQLKGNISYLHDVQKLQYQKTEQTFILNDTVAYTEIQNNKQRPDLINAELNVAINRDKYYVSNTFNGNIYYNSAQSMLMANNNTLQQNLTAHTFGFSNEFNYIYPLKKDLILNFYSFTNRTTRPENRTITPGFNPAIFNNNTIYSQLIQESSIPTWVTNNHVSLQFPIKGILLNHKLGFNMVFQKLQSSLTALQYDMQQSSALDSASNNLNWLRKKFYYALGIDVPATKFKLSMQLPIMLQHTAYNDNKYMLSQAVSHLYFNPALQFKYQTSTENYVSFNYNMNNDIGNINDVYRGYILQNYRTLFANNAGLTEQRTHNFLLGYNYRKAIQIFFFSVDIGYKTTSANTIANNISTADFQQRSILPFQNNTSGWSARGNISKYIFLLKTTLSGGPTVQLNTANFIQNGTLLPFKTQSTGFNTGFETKLTDALDLSYQNYFTHINSSSAATTGSAFNQLRQASAINYTPINNLYFKVSGDNYFVKQPLMRSLNYFFTDVSCRYNLSKKKITLEINALNLFNTTSYSTAYLADNIFGASIYKIPGRIIMGSLTFNY